MPDSRLLQSGRPALRVAVPADAARGAEALAHLLAVLENAARVLEERMFDVDAKIVEAHRAQLARGREWPGDEITPCEDYLPGPPLSDEPRGTCVIHGDYWTDDCLRCRNAG